MQLSKKFHGFTLIELIVVMGIFVLMTVLIIPAYRSYSRRDQSRQAAQSIRSFMVEAQNKAYAPKEVEVTDASGVTFRIIPKDYGIHFSYTGTNLNPTIILFRDLNDNKLYESNEEVINTYNLPQGICFHGQIEVAPLSNTGYLNPPNEKVTDIAFASPDAKVFVNGHDANNLQGNDPGTTPKILDNIRINVGLCGATTFTMINLNCLTGQINTE
jgi:prepilin-type N-terminal cleavage/methylation domain-containing protein